MVSFLSYISETDYLYNIKILLQYFQFFGNFLKKVAIYAQSSMVVIFLFFLSVLKPADLASSILTRCVNHFSLFSFGVCLACSICSSFLILYFISIAFCLPIERCSIPNYHSCMVNIDLQSLLSPCLIFSLIYPLFISKWYTLQAH